MNIRTSDLTELKVVAVDRSSMTVGIRGVGLSHGGTVSGEALPIFSGL